MILFFLPFVPSIFYHLASSLLTLPLLAISLPTHTHTLYSSPRTFILTSTCCPFFHHFLSFPFLTFLLFCALFTTTLAIVFTHFFFILHFYFTRHHTEFGWPAQLTSPGGGRDLLCSFTRSDIFYCTVVSHCCFVHTCLYFCTYFPSFLYIIFVHFLVVSITSTLSPIRTFIGRSLNKYEMSVPCESWQKHFLVPACIQCLKRSVTLTTALCIALSW